jgi:hypothetical protein
VCTLELGLHEIDIFFSVTTNTHSDMLPMAIRDWIIRRMQADLVISEQTGKRTLLQVDV